TEKIDHEVQASACRIESLSEQWLTFQMNEFSPYLGMTPCRGGTGPWLQDHLQSDRDVLVAREVVDILHFHHQPWIMPPPSSPPTPVPGFSGLSGLLGLQPAWARSPADGLTAELRRLSCV
ncbi:hypothetical protein, partial [Pseudomonas aeruginosa]